MQNPFKPTAGATPPVLIGRAGLLDEFEYGLQQGSGAPGLLTIITGSRGIGKTVMLSAAEGIARTHGWAVISRTANPGFFAGIGDDMLGFVEELGDGPPARKITAFSAAGFGLTTQLPPERTADWRRIGNELLRLLDAKGTGLVITIDEIHAVDRTEISQLAADVQHFIRDGLPIGLIFAGLPSAVSDLLNEGVATFLRRADRINLHEAAIAEVTASYSELFSDGGITVTPELINEAAEATEGYPFLIQLVGYYLWLEAGKASWKLDESSVHSAITAAQRRNTLVVVESALSDISDKDREFLDAMAVQEGPSAAGQIGNMMKAKPNVVSKYRKRLIAAGLIESAGYGKVDFAIPGLRQYLREIASA
ncbi:ATP-binding protein [Paenarthrobacter sp. PH39-S1]|uniref:AAA family ATPase n=1 Tax=Paenarthrobacter sp. PH39-S1 TaxID=3046204 RepID=UPI0024BA73B2|nr:ATP-binding protein [Paenarthrobacter sp. PH39-S1]MDJ0358462.1 ATP-binding protein [Paenarthrobacter sp. PH39-S1]